MGVTQRHSDQLKYPKIDTFLNEFQFAQAKKYIALKEPLCWEVISDEMYPLLKYGDIVKIEHSEDQGIKRGLIVYYTREKLRVGHLSVRESGKGVVTFLNSSHENEDVEDRYVLGFVTPYRMSFFSLLIFRVRVFYKFWI